jgi:glutamate-ammonia-ligase adenylyltransferase
MTALNRELTTHTTEGYLYRVDLRLRPYGSSGMLVYPLDAAVAYYRDSAAAWERQAAIKLGPVAGNRALAERLRAAVHETIPRRVEPHEVTDGIRALREQKTRALEASPNVVDVKEGRGGIRDIEFLVQGLQLLAAARPGSGGDAGASGAPRLEGNTLRAVAELAARGTLDPETAELLREDYIFLRKSEHVLQIAADRQVHSLRLDADDSEIVARRMQQAQGISEEFWPRLSRTLERAHRLYDTMLSGPARSDR